MHGVLAEGEAEGTHARTLSYLRIKNIKFNNSNSRQKLRTLNKLKHFTLAPYGTATDRVNSSQKEGIFDNIVRN